MSAKFHRLTVAAVEPLTADAVRIVFAVPRWLRPQYRYTAGQHLTIRFTEAQFPGLAAPAPAAPGPDGAPARLTAAKLRRSYSLCEAPPAVGSPRRLSIAVKRHDSAGFADYAVRRLAPGEQLDVLTPTGGFHSEPDVGHTGPNRIVAVAVGSGITPILAIIQDALRADPRTSAVLLYGNRTRAEVMFGEDLAALRARYGARFEVLHVLSREDLGDPLLTGRIDKVKLPQLLSAVRARASDAYYLCGPYEMVSDARELLEAAGARHIRFELFATSAAAKAAAAEAAAVPSAGPAAAGSARQAPALVEVALGGRRTRCEFRPGDTGLLDAVLRERPEVPFACTDGFCGTCRARLVKGTVATARDYALEPEERSRGYILTCQSVPTSPTVGLDFDG